MTKTKGFTLVEIIIVVAIVAIIAAIALPSYQNQVQKGRRADALAALLQARQAMERHYNKYYSYADAEEGKTFPDKSPIDGDAVYYNLDLTTGLAGNTFTIRATPAGPQAADPCGALSINHAGQKGAKGDSPQTTSMADIDECWR